MVLPNDGKVVKISKDSHYPKRYLRFNFHSGKLGKCSEVEYRKGDYKTVILTSSEAFCFYGSAKHFEIAKNRYESFSASLPFPYAKVLGFDSKDRYAKSALIKGEVRLDEEHIALALSSLLSFGLNAPIDKRSQTYLQHGDANAYNILWTNESEFAFIDLDDIGYHPILEDFFDLFASANLSGSWLRCFCKKESKALQSLLARFDKPYSDDMLDELLSSWATRKCASPWGFSKMEFLLLDETASFPKAKETAMRHKR